MPPGRPPRLPDGERPPFSWVGGTLCLDFLNTVSWRAPGLLENERLRTAADLTAWAVAARLQHEARTFDDGTLAFAHELRHGLHELLLRAARQESPADGEVEWLNRWIRDTGRHVRVAPTNGDSAWHWQVNSTAEEFDPGLALLGVIVRSALDLLRSSDRPLLRVCANDRCGWLFLDRSRKHNRRWCEMRECGGRAKARRYQSRRRAASAEQRDGGTGPRWDEAEQTS